MADSDLQKEFNNLKNDIGKLRADVGNLTATLNEIAAERVGRAKERINSGAHETVEAVRQRFDEARVKNREMIDSLEEHVSEHPMSSLLAAVGVGFALAKLISNGARH